MVETAFNKLPHWGFRGASSWAEVMISYFASMVDCGSIELESAEKSLWREWKTTYEVRGKCVSMLQPSSSWAFR